MGPIGSGQIRRAPPPSLPSLRAPSRKVSRIFSCAVPGPSRRLRGVDGLAPVRTQATSIATNIRATLPPGAPRMDWTWYLFRFDGRINRALLWQALLIVALLAGLLEVIGQVVRAVEGGTSLALKLGFDIDFDFALDDVFRAIDPRTYHSL